MKSMELTVILYMACFFMYILKKNNVIKNLKVLPIIIFLVIIFSWLILKGGYEFISILYMVLLSWFFMYILKKNNVITKLKITTLFMPIIIVLAGIILSGIASIGITYIVNLLEYLSYKAAVDRGG